MICTKDRPADVQRAVRSLLSSRGVEIELIVVDQSQGPETRAALSELQADGRLRYVQNQVGGKSTSMNIGLRLARSRFVVCTDDDCEAPPEWVAGMATALQRRPEVAAVFSNVVAGPHDTSVGYIPVYEQRTDRMLSSLLATRHGWGMGAGMALRRDVVLSLGGLDEAIGPGARFPSGDDVDLELRLLLRGWRVFHTSEFATVHHGLRTFDQGHAHIYRNFWGNGATEAKLLKCRHLSALVLALWVLGVKAAYPPLNDLLHLRRPRGLRRSLAFCGGFAAGLRAEVDRATMMFVPLVDLPPTTS